MRFAPYLPENPEFIDPKRQVKQRFVAGTIEREIGQQALGGLYPLENVYNLKPKKSGLLAFGELYEVHKVEGGVPIEILRVSPPRELVMKLLGGSGVELIGSDQLVVLCGPNGKMQFETHVKRISDDDEIFTTLPTELTIIQRRQQFRVLSPHDSLLFFVIKLGAGQELLTKVIDISSTGIQLDVRREAAQINTGRYLHGCYFERMRSRSGPIDLIVRNNRPGFDLDRIRIGCELYEPDDRALKEMESTRSAIENARAESRLNRWHNKVCWYDE
jgi:hypothetical protein